MKLHHWIIIVFIQLLHDFREDDLNCGLGGFGIELVVQGDFSKVSQPSERSFHDSSQRYDIELLLAVGSRISCHFCH